MKKILGIIIIATVSFGLKAQEHVVRVNATTLLWGVLEHQYEYLINPKVSVQLGAGFVKPGASSLLNLASFDFVNNPYVTDVSAGVKTYGYRFTPEVKYYLSGNKEKYGGMYVNAFLRYYKYGVKLKYEATINGVEKKQKETFFVHDFGGGIGIGGQWFIKDKISVDVQMLGIGYTGRNLNLRYKSDLDVDWESQEFEGFDVNVGDWEYDVDAEAVDNGYKITSKNPLPGFIKFNVSIGYKF